MSFKLKLVAYFLLVSLIPLSAAGWGLHAVAGRSETRKVDVRLEAGLRAVLPGGPARGPRERASRGRPVRPSRPHPLCPCTRQDPRRRWRSLPDAGCRRATGLLRRRARAALAAGEDRPRRRLGRSPAPDRA